ncbi:MAG: ribosome-binding factor A [Candidatus Paceibacterota bacterium]|jgi:ribosome-binding factor A
MGLRDDRIKSIVQELATKFIEAESNRLSLITVTSITLTDKAKGATIMFTVFPETAEKAALDFLKRQRAEFREFVKAHSRLSMIPFFDFAVDQGEKNRQKIDQISNLVK